MAPLPPPLNPPMQTEEEEERGRVGYIIRPLSQHVAAASHAALRMAVLCEQTSTPCFDHLRACLL